MAERTTTTGERLGELTLIDLRRRRVMQAAAAELRAFCVGKRLGGYTAAVDRVADRLEAASGFGRPEPEEVTDADLVELARYGVDGG